MVKKELGLFLLLFFSLLPGAQGVEFSKKEIAQEIKYAFEKDILISKKISANRKFYQSNYDLFENKTEKSKLSDKELSDAEKLVKSLIKDV